MQTSGSHPKEIHQKTKEQSQESRWKRRGLGRVGNGKRKGGNLCTNIAGRLELGSEINTALARRTETTRLHILDTHPFRFLFQLNFFEQSHF
jgi:hypothetical protein